MKVKDIVNNIELELDRDELILKMKDGRQVDLILKEKKTDDVGYLTWDMEQWSTVDGKRFIRTYQLNGRVLSEYTSHNIHDLKAYLIQIVIQSQLVFHEHLRIIYYQLF